jgi:serine/threonine protein kinase
LYELMVGRPPFTEGAAIEILMAHISTPPPPIPRALGLSAAIESVIMRALSKRPEERFDDAPAMAEALKAALRGEPSIDTAQRGHGTLVDDVSPVASRLPSTMVLDEGQHAHLSQEVDLEIASMDMRRDSGPLKTDATPNFAPSKPIRPRKPGGRRKKILMFVAAVLLAAGVGIAIWAAVSGPDKAKDDVEGPVRIRIGN